MIWCYVAPTIIIVWCLRQLWKRFKPDRWMCPLCLGSGCEDCDWRGDNPTDPK